MAHVDGELVRAHKSGAKTVIHHGEGTHNAPIY
jgi:hypothetical protein